MTEYEKIAVEKGYVIDESGFVYNSKGKLVNGTIRNKYKCICFKINGKDKKIPFHRLQAYQKFGDEIYKDDIEIRHLDNNPLNNSYENIGIGSNSDNKFDRPIEMRKRIAANANKKYSDELVLEIKDYYNSGHTYKEIMEKFNISSKGTLSHIINKR